MQLIGILLAACVLMALLRMTIAALLISALILLLWAALYHPRETIGFMMVSAALGLMQLHPVLSLAALCLGALLHSDE